VLFVKWISLLRIAYNIKNPKAWVFACKECLEALKVDNPKYIYRLTWKQ